MKSALRVVENFDEPQEDHPLEGVEKFLNAKSLSFQRLTDDELFIELQGRFGLYRLVFVWNAELGAMQFCAQLDLQITEANTEKALAIIAEINTRSWIGHFDLPSENNIPTYRHTQLLRDDDAGFALNYISDMMDISIAQCDKNYATFLTLAHEECATSEDLFFAQMPAQGRCH